MLHDAKNLNVSLSYFAFSFRFSLSFFSLIIKSNCKNQSVDQYVVVVLVVCCVLALLCWPKVRVFHVALGNQLCPLIARVQLVIR